jgi:hypothetical protein
MRHTSIYKPTSQTVGTPVDKNFQLVSIPVVIESYQLTTEPTSYHFL